MPLNLPEITKEQFNEINSYLDLIKDKTAARVEFAMANNEINLSLSDNRLDINNLDDANEEKKKQISALLKIALTEGQYKEYADFYDLPPITDTELNNANCNLRAKSLSGFLENYVMKIEIDDTNNIFAANSLYTITSAEGKQAHLVPSGLLLTFDLQRSSSEVLGEIKYLSDNININNIDSVRAFGLSSLKNIAGIDKVQADDKASYIEKYEWLPSGFSDEKKISQLRTYSSDGVNFSLHAKYNGLSDQPIKDVILFAGDYRGAMGGNTGNHEDVKKWVMQLEQAGARVHLVTGIYAEMNGYTDTPYKVGEIPLFPEDLEGVRKSINGPASVIIVSHGAMTTRAFYIPEDLNSIKGTERRLKGADPSALDEDFSKMSEGDKYFLMNYVLSSKTNDFIKSVNSVESRTDISIFTCMYGYQAPKDFNQLQKGSLGYVAVEGAALHRTTQLYSLFDAIATVKPESFSAENIAKLDLLKREQTIRFESEFKDITDFADSNLSPRLMGLGEITGASEDLTYNLQAFAIQRMQNKNNGRVFSDFETTLIKEDKFVNKLYAPEEVDQIISYAEKSNTLADIPPEYIRAFVGFSYIAEPSINPALAVSKADKELEQQDKNVSLLENNEGIFISIKSADGGVELVQIPNAMINGNKVDVEGGLSIQVKGKKGTGIYKSGETKVSIKGGTDVDDLLDVVDIALASHNNAGSLTISEKRSDIQDAIDAAKYLSIFNDEPGVQNGYINTGAGFVTKKPTWQK